MSRRCIAECISSCVITKVHNLTDDNVILLQDRVDDRQPCLGDRLVGGVLVLASVVLLGFHELLLATGGDVAVLLILIHAVIQTPEEPTLDR